MIDPYELGQVWNFLITHRVIRSKVPDGQRFKPGERDISHYLQHEWTEHEMAFLRNFLSEQGFGLRIYDSDTMPGIPTGGVYYMIIRNPESPAPSWVDENRIWDRFRLKRTETKEQLRVWFFVLWQNLLGLEYTALDRHISATSEYLNASFTKESLLESVRRFIEDLRQETEFVNPVVETLFQNKGRDIERRINVFIEILEELGQIIDNKDGSYNQTLLAAKEAEENYGQSLRHLLPHPTLDADIFETLYSDAGNEEDFESEEVEEENSEPELFEEPEVFEEKNDNIEPSSGV